MKGWKGTYGMECRGFRFEVGKTYEIRGKLEMCRNGFHFCQDQQNVLSFYTPRYKSDIYEFMLLEVEAIGEVLTEGNKSVTDKIRIVRVVPFKEWDFVENGYAVFREEIAPGVLPLTEEGFRAGEWT